MIPDYVNMFLWGALAMASIAVCLFFLRFWRVSRERLFLFFALAFVAFAANWAGLALVNPPVESRHYLYLVRLLAFVLIIVGIVDKNRRSAER
jgi:hypothetical protein